MTESVYTLTGNTRSTLSTRRKLSSRAISRISMSVSTRGLISFTARYLIFGVDGITIGSRTITVSGLGGYGGGTQPLVDVNKDTNRPMPMPSANVIPCVVLVDIVCDYPYIDKSCTTSRLYPSWQCIRVLY